MDKVSRIAGVGVPMKRSNIDTDQIIPAQFLKRVTKTGFEDALFYAWRQQPDFILNTAPYDHGRVLVTGPDFGTGSSREHAVWALRDFGFQAVLSPRFGDIFRGNSGKQGLLAAAVEEAHIEQIWALLEATPGLEVEVDLPTQTVTVGNLTVPFEIDAYTKWRLMEGLDDIALTLRDEAEITRFESRRESWRPATLPVREPAKVVK
jgi:3-isopropylmalate/(R)-2-methylmalate dehydratase small subunit